MLGKRYQAFVYIHSANVIRMLVRSLTEGGTNDYNSVLVEFPKNECWECDA